MKALRVQGLGFRIRGLGFQQGSGLRAKVRSVVFRMWVRFLSASCTVSRCGHHV